MRVIEPRKYVLPARIDDPRSWPGEGFDIGGGTYDHDAVSQHRHGLGQRPRFIHGVDGGVKNDQVGRERRGGRFGGIREHSERSEECRAEAFHRWEPTLHFEV